MSECNDLCFTDEESKGNRRSKTTITNNPLSQGCEPDTTTSLSSISPDTSSNGSSSPQALSDHLGAQLALTAAPTAITFPEKPARTGTTFSRSEHLKETSRLGPTGPGKRWVGQMGTHPLGYTKTSKGFQDTSRLSLLCMGRRTCHMNCLHTLPKICQERHTKRRVRANLWSKTPLHRGAWAGVLGLSQPF